MNANCFTNILVSLSLCVSVCDQVVNFVCPVRSQCTQSVTLPSRINQRWTLKCVIEGEHWSGPPTLLIDPPQQNTYEITYKPLVMTADGQRHEVRLLYTTLSIVFETAVQLKLYVN